MAKYPPPLPSDPSLPNPLCMGVMNATTDQSVLCDPEKYDKGRIACFTQVGRKGKKIG